MAVWKPKGGAFTKGRGDLFLPPGYPVIYQGRFGVDAATSLKNFANPAVPATADGTLTFGTTNVDLNGHPSTGFKRIITTVPVPADAEDVTFIALVTKPSAACSVLETIDGTARTGIAATASGFEFRNHGTSGQALMLYPSDIGAKYLWVVGKGRRGGRDFPTLQMGVGGTKLTSAITKPTGRMSTGTSVGTTRTGVGGLQWARNGGGSGNFKAMFGAVILGDPDQEWLLEAYQRARTLRGSALVY